MGDVGKIAQPQQLTPDQQQALKKLHDAAQQLEGVFMQMVMSAMQDTVPKDSIFGKDSQSESTWQDMLTNERSQEMAKNGGLGLAKTLEAQLRSQVLADAKHESHVQVDRRTDL